MAGGMNNGRNQSIGLNRLARKVAEVEPDQADEPAAVPSQRLAGDEHDPWRHILQQVNNDSARWALALTHAHETTGVTHDRITQLTSDEMEAFAAEVRGWLVDHPATRQVRPW